MKEKDCSYCKHPDNWEVLFKSEVHDRAKSIDPDNELDWYSMTIGWGIAHKLIPEEAIDLALHIRYHTNLG